MYELGKIEALRALGLTKHAGMGDTWAALTKGISPQAAKKAKHLAIGGALTGGALGGVYGAYGEGGDRSTTNRVLGGTAMGMFGGALGGGLGGLHGIMKGRGHPGLILGNGARGGAIAGAMTGGMNGLASADRDNMIRNTLVGAVGGGAIGGAAGTAMDSISAIEPDFANFVRHAARSRGHDL